MSVSLRVFLSLGVCISLCVCLSILLSVYTRDQPSRPIACSLVFHCLKVSRLCLSRVSELLLGTLSLSVYRAYFNVQLMTISAVVKCYLQL